MLETDRSAESRFHLTGNVEMVKNRLRVLVEFDDLRALGSNELQIMTYFFVDLLVIDLDGCEIRTEDVPDDSNGAPHLFAHEANRFFLLQGLDGVCPALHEQTQFAVQLCGAFVFRYRADDDAETPGLMDKSSCLRRWRSAPRLIF